MYNTICLFSLKLVTDVLKIIKNTWHKINNFSMDVYKVYDSLLSQKHAKYKFLAHIADYSSSFLPVFMG